MSRNDGPPAWAKWLVWCVGGGILLAGWATLGSKLFMLMLFRGRPPVASTPWNALRYVMEYGYRADVVKAAGFSYGLTGVALIVFLVIMLRPKGRSLYGDARFQNAREMRASGLLEDHGVIVGRYNGRYLVSPGQHHVLLAAPTGTGKGIGVVIPNLLAWNDSAIVLDVKLENWGLTAGFRAKHGHQVYLFNPGAPDRRTHRWNFLGYVREDHADRVDDLQKVAQLLFPDIAGVDPIWSGGCRTLFLGLALYLFETPDKPRTPGQVAREAFGLDVAAFRTLLADRRAAGKPLSAACELAMTDFLNAPDKTRDSIRKTFTSRMELFLNPNIDAATSANDFDLAQLRSQRITVYLGVTPDNLGRFAPLLNLFFQQVLDLHTREVPERNPALKHQLLLLMDEFVAMGKMQVLVDGIAFLRGYNVRLLPIFQSPEQVKAIYGVHHSAAFFDNHSLRIVYEPATLDAAEHISKELGNETVSKESVSRPRFGGKGSGSVSDSEHGRALLLPQELQRIGSDTEILFLRGQRPVKCDKINYFREPIFVDRLKSVSPRLALIKGDELPREALAAALAAGELAPEVPVLEAVVVDPLPAPVDERPFRAVGLEDLDKIHLVPLSDFSTDFSKIEVPDRELDEDEQAAFADQVYQQLLNN